jgi:hypothetical protein
VTVLKAVARAVARVVARASTTVVTTAVVPTTAVAAVVGDTCNNGNDGVGVDGGDDDGG